jgi:hypothetical protein
MEHSRSIKHPDDEKMKANSMILSINSERRKAKIGFQKLILHARSLGGA